ncbi:MAG TPA: hypothetical protein VKP67_27755 [Xanthobacteraceae bacterium]|nr:hypothetical protein [Xanthobacteraceae bacterium]
MMIDRREFIAGASVVVVAPTLQLLPSQQPFSASCQDRVRFLIHGWSDGDDGAAADQVWIKISNSWRTAWR